MKSIIEQSAAAGVNPVVHAARELGYSSVDDFLDEMARIQRVREDVVKAYINTYHASLDGPELYVPYFARKAIEGVMGKLDLSTIDPSKLDPKVRLKLVPKLGGPNEQQTPEKRQKPKMIRRFGVGGKR